MIAIIVLLLFTIFTIRFLYRRSISPSRPILTCLLDTLTDIPAFLKIGPWGEAPDIQTAMKRAMKSTKLTDFGSTNGNAFISKYTVARKNGLAKSQAKFSPAGHLTIQQSLSQRIEVRLKFMQYIKDHPSILKTKIKPPVFVIGFPRTGTTYLHEILGLHDQVRMHYTWEQLDPIPVTKSEDLKDLTKDRKARYDKNKPLFNFIFKNLIHEKIQHIHRIAYDEPEECTIPCSLELPWGLTEIPFMVFAADEVFPLGAGEAFQIYRKFLQLLTWQSEDRRDKDFTWMLKCPFHLPYLEELFDAFPGATVVWTHRDPAECIASACSLYETIMQMGLEESTVDPKAIGKAVMNYSKKSLDKAEETFTKLKDKNIKMVHIRYADNIKEPKKICKQVFDTAGIEYNGDYEKKLDAYLAKSKAERQKLKEKKGSIHDYKPEDYGLTKEQIQETFKEYIAKYNLLEKK